MPRPGPSSLTLLLVERNPWLTHLSLSASQCPPNQGGWCMGHNMVMNPTMTARPTQQVAGQHMTGQGH